MGDGGAFCCYLAARQQMKPNMSAEPSGPAFHVQIKVERISANEIMASAFD